MIQITPHIRIYLHREAVDFRKGIDGLVGVCRRQLEKDPFSGSMFIFRNKNRKSLKILLYDGQGFWLFIKRLSKGRFKWWPNPQDHSEKVLNLNAAGKKRDGARKRGIVVPFNFFPSLTVDFVDFFLKRMYILTMLKIETIKEIIEKHKKEISEKYHISEIGIFGSYTRIHVVSRRLTATSIYWFLLISPLGL